MHSPLPHRLVSEALRFTERSHAPEKMRSCHRLLTLLETHSAVEMALRQALIQSDLTEKGFHILAFLAQRDTAASASDLAAELGLPRHTAIEILVRLELSGLLNRQPGPDDHRFNTVDLSPRGRAVLNHALEHITDAVSQIMSAASEPELTQLEQICARLRHSSETQTSF